MSKKHSKQQRQLTKQQNQPIQSTVIAAKHFQGPLPPPEILLQYEQITPGFADRIISSWEKQTLHRQEIENTAIGAQVKNSKRGAIFAFILGFMAIIGGTICIIMGYSASGISEILFSLGSLVGVYVYGSEKNRKERIEKTKEMVNIKGQ
jgi:uncharacterized membrane protein